MNNLELNRSVVAQVAEIAKVAAKYLKGPAGTYTAKQIYTGLYNQRAKYYFEFSESRKDRDQLNNNNVVQVDTFRCEFSTGLAFAILFRFEQMAGLSRHNKFQVL